jgi:hypothetical protein
MSEASTLQCRDLVELMTEFIEDTMPAGQRSRFEEHLAVCLGCRNYLDQLRTTIRVAGRLTEDSLSSDAWGELLVAFRDWGRSST